jgi:hypothetical protein
VSQPTNIGVTMGEAIAGIFFLLVSVAAIFAVVSGSRIHSKWWLARRMYMHVDEVIGAKAFEREYAATMRHMWGKYKDKNGVEREAGWAKWFWPSPELSGTMARPHWWRRRQYVQIGYVDKPWPQPFFKKDIVLVTLTYTSEANPNNKNYNFFVVVEQKVAQALSLPWTEDTFEHNAREYPHTGGLTDHRPARDQVSLIVAEPLRLSSKVSGADLLNGRVDTNRANQ